MRSMPSQGYSHHRRTTRRTCCCSAILGLLATAAVCINQAGGINAGDTTNAIAHQNRTIAVEPTTTVEPTTNGDDDEFFNFDAKDRAIVAAEIVARDAERALSEASIRRPSDWQYSRKYSPPPHTLADIAARAREYATASPFPHIFVDNVFPRDFLETVVTELPQTKEQLHAADEIGHNQSKNFHKYSGQAKKLGTSYWDIDTQYAKRELHAGLMGANTKQMFAELRSPSFVQFLEKLTGINRLIPDPGYSGSGVHITTQGGMLKVHADYNRLKIKKKDWQRRVNVFVYLNKDWPDEWKGHLQLFDKDMTGCVKSIHPSFGRLVVFSSTDFSYHGHPEPLRAPDGRARLSLALYYYTDNRPASECKKQDCASTHSTLWQKTDDAMMCVGQKAPAVMEGVGGELIRWHSNHSLVDLWGGLLYPKTALRKEIEILRHLYHEHTEPQCGTARNHAKLKLVCAKPDHRIASVKFASFGTPTGDCNTGFNVSTACHEASSKQYVEERCVGKKTCTLIVSKKTFGGNDPCFKTEKRLSVKVDCKPKQQAAILTENVNRNEQLAAIEPATLPAVLTSVVIAHCSHSLDWLPGYLHGTPINDVTIYSKCGHVDALAQSDYIDQIHAIGRQPAVFKVLPNVGGCDHTYAHDMAHRDWAAYAGHGTKHVVLYLKDTNQDSCSKNLDFKQWTTLRPSTLVQVAAISGFGCLIKPSGFGTLWHTTVTTESFKIEKYKREAGTERTEVPLEVDNAPVLRPASFRAAKKDFINVGQFAVKMGITVPEPFMQVCYKGNFAVSGAHFVDADGTKKQEKRTTAQNLELALSRGNNIEEGHFMERLWAAWLQTPPTPNQVAAIRAIRKTVCARNNCNENLSGIDFRARGTVLGMLVYFVEDRVLYRPGYHKKGVCSISVEAKAAAAAKAKLYVALFGDQVKQLHPRLGGA